MDRIRYLPPEEKGRTRELWERVFAEDGPEFLDYYYEVKTRDNAVLVLEKDGQIRSMLQLNPYRLRLGERGTEAEAAYVVAVATEAFCRHQGMMRRLLVRAMEDLREQRQPFLFLMPADRAIYLPFGFRFIYRQRQGMLRAGAGAEAGEAREGLDAAGMCAPGCAGEGDGFRAEPLPVGAEAEAAELASLILNERQQVYARRDADYYRVLRAESRAEGGDVMRIMKGERMIGLFSCTKGEEGTDIREPLFLRAYACRSGEILREVLAPEQFPARGYGLADIREEGAPGREMTERERGGESASESAEPDRQPAEAGWEALAEVPMIMARLVHLPALLEAFRAEADTVLILRTEDALLPANSGVYRWELGPGYSRVQLLRGEKTFAGPDASGEQRAGEERKGEAQAGGDSLEADLDVSAEALMRLLFFQGSPEEIMAGERCTMTEEGRRKWENVRVWKRVFLNEAV